jgi:ATP-dependent Clp protease protease subunit
MKDIKTDLEILQLYDIYLPDSTLYLGSHGTIDGEESGVDFQMAERLIKNLHVLDKEENKNGIFIKMNNPGGCSVHGLAIYDAIKACRSHVTIIGYGHIMSMGSVIFQAADMRVMAPHARMMLHMGSAGFSDSMGNFYSNVEEFKKLDEMLLDIYMTKIKEKKPRFQRAKLKANMAVDWYLNGKEAIELGLSDRVLE